MRSQGPTVTTVASTGAGAERSAGLASRAASALVHLYQRLMAGRASPCRFVPSCSTYALDAYEHHGFLKGSWLSVRRLARCHPWGGSGWDPVPDRDGHRAPEPTGTTDCGHLPTERRNS
ncbi:MAG: membrane protein insertion efficiency factor YidD [Acidimicrobiia bacterium]|nr:membrane protein insertion efficiency factor YidD [Acidimicrobiia bacterium]